MTAFKTVFVVLTVMGGVWLTAIGAVLYAVNAFQQGGAGKTVADGSIIMTVLALALIINVAIVAPGLLMLQPFRLWRVARDERRAITPRQRFRGRSSRSFCEPFFMYQVYLLLHLLFAISLAACVGRAVLKWIPDQPFISFFDSRLPRGIRPCVRHVVLHSRHYFCLGICSNPSVGRTGGDPAVASDTNRYVFRFSLIEFSILILWLLMTSHLTSNSTPVPRWLCLRTHKVTHGWTRATVHVAAICASHGASATGARTNSAQPTVVAGSGSITGNLACGRTLCGAVL